VADAMVSKYATTGEDASGPLRAGLSSTAASREIASHTLERQPERRGGINRGQHRLRSARRDSAHHEFNHDQLVGIDPQ